MEILSEHRLVKYLGDLPVFHIATRYGEGRSASRFSNCQNILEKHNEKYMRQEILERSVHYLNHEKGKEANPCQKSVRIGILVPDMKGKIFNLIHETRHF